MNNLIEWWVLYYFCSGMVLLSIACFIYLIYIESSYGYKLNSLFFIQRIPISLFVVNIFLWCTLQGIAGGQVNPRKSGYSEPVRKKSIPLKKIEWCITDEEAEQLTP